MFKDDVKRIWLRVIIQLIDDYISPNPVGANKEEQEAAKLQAIAWFEGNSLDYRKVCNYADIDPSWLRNKVLTSDTSKLNAIIKEFRETM